MSGQFTIKTGSGEPVACNHRYDNVIVSIQDVAFAITLYGLPLAPVEVIFGMPWLQDVSPATFDGRNLSVNIRQGDHEVLLHGIGENPPSHVRVNMLYKEVSEDSKVFLLNKSGVETITAAPTEVTEQPGLPDLLAEYKEVTEEPKSLSPDREFDHRIRLVDEAAPVNVPPYRYAHFQKNVIERQVDEMLESGLIRHSTTPFSSPVLLVKKMDGTWRFCTDYRAPTKPRLRIAFLYPLLKTCLTSSMVPSSLSR